MTQNGPKPDIPTLLTLNLFPHLLPCGRCSGGSAAFVLEDDEQRKLYDIEVIVKCLQPMVDITVERGDGSGGGNIKRLNRGLGSGTNKYKITCELLLYLGSTQA